MMKAMLIIFALFATCYCKVEFSERARNFSVELLYYTAEETNWHTVISPFGVWSLLTGVSIGATGSSREELVTTLILPKNPINLINGYKYLTSAVLRSGTPDVELKSKNFLFSDNSFLMRPNFMRSIRYDFNAILLKLSFKPSQSAAQRANSVIEKYAVGVSNVLKADDLENSRMILTNVITFKGLWQTPFNVSETKVESFYDEDGMKIGEVNMMNQQGSLPFSSLDAISSMVLELPYGNEEINKYSFLVVLPYSGVKVASVYKTLSQVSLKDIFGKLQNDTDMYGMSEVMVSLPRFKISTNVVLNRPLSKMGINDIFDSNTASFKMITESNDIFVSAIVHKADIEVTETGTVASASSSASFADRMMPSSFKANKPFIYLVIEKTTYTIIFSGVYSKPSKF